MSRAEILKANESYHDIEAYKYDVNQPFIINKFTQSYFIDDVEELVKDSGKPPQALTVLDCGAGTGNLSLKFLARGCSVTAVDISERMLEQLGQKAQPSDRSRLSPVHSDIDGFLDRTDLRYDIVCSSSFLHHLPDYRATYRRLARTCKDDGQIYTAFEPSPQSQWGLAQKLLSTFDLAASEFILRRYYRPDVLARGILRRAGILHSAPPSPAAAIDPTLIERPDLGISSDVLSEILRDLGFNQIIVRWRSIKRSWVTYLIDRYLVRSRNALFLIARRRADMPK